MPDPGLKSAKRPQKKLVVEGEDRRRRPYAKGHGDDADHRNVRRFAERSEGKPEIHGFKDSRPDAARFTSGISLNSKRY